MAPYLQAHFEHRHDEGYVSLSIAENHQVFDLLKERLEEPLAIPAHVVGYDDMAGKADLRTAIAGLFEREIFHRAVDPAHVRVLSGASGVLEALGHVLGDPGDGVLIPTPSYAGFWPDLEVRPGLHVVPAATLAEDGFHLTPDILEQALADAEVPVTTLLLTNPDNPRGQVIAADDVEAALQWAESHALHVIVDEIYALSVFGESFTSVGQLRPSLGERIHVVWAVSKDFGMSGLRCGAVISENDQVLGALDLQGLWSGVSGHTQHLLAGMLTDEDWLQAYLTWMRQRLQTASQLTTTALDQASIPHLAPTAGFFLLCDLRDHLDQPTWEAEHDLWQHVLDEAQVNLTPGSALRAGEPGWFRICYAAGTSAVVTDAIHRVGSVLAR